MLVAGCSMLVENPVFSGDKEKPFLIPSSIQYHVLTIWDYVFLENLT